MITPRDPDHVLRRLAVAAWWALVAVTVTGTAISAAAGRARGTSGPSAFDLSFDVTVLAFGLTGFLILRRQPRNRFGWVLSGVGTSWGFAAAVEGYASYGLLVRPGSVPAPELAAALWQGLWAPGITVMCTFVILLFPDGHLPSRRWRPVAWASASAIPVMYVAVTLLPGEVTEGPWPAQRNPLGVEQGEAFFSAALLGGAAMLVGCGLASACALIVRFRGSSGVQREQLKWLASAGAVVTVLFLANAMAPPRSDAVGWVALLTLSRVSFLLIPAAIAVAVLRHGLYDIDVVVNRTLVYGSLTATLAATYLGSVVLLQALLRPVTSDSDLAVAGSTLAVAGLFGPLRRRIQIAVDRRFYRQRYDAARTVADFTGQLSHQVDLDAIGRDLVRVVDDTVRPVTAQLWVRR